MAARAPAGRRKPAMGVGCNAVLGGLHCREPAPKVFVDRIAHPQGQTVQVNVRQPSSSNVCLNPPSLLGVERVHFDHFGNVRDKSLTTPDS